MKIIIVEKSASAYNFSVRNALYNNTYAQETSDCALLTLPDTALLRSGMPLFVPDTAWPLAVRVYAACRISRLGRCIDKSFAHRYYDTVGMAVNFCAEKLCDTLRGMCLPEDMARGFDGSVGIGKMVPAHESNNLPKEMILKIDGVTKTVLTTEGLQTTLDEGIAFASRFFKLCHGDLILTAGEVCETNLQTEQMIEGFCDEDRCLEIKIK